MKHVSARGGVAPVRFKDAVMMGLASDGGLVVPEAVPDERPTIPWTELTYPNSPLKLFGSSLMTSATKISNE